MSDKKVRCAIYTRKSTEEGLEQEFNSLQAQREACEAYIKSQKHEHWQLLPNEYDDGGYSGGNLERPALKRLLSDIKNGLVDIIVVYKIDRLTRSLMDFSKIVEVLDKHNASFVSITQHFNTTTSMGRLTLNMLLSFAQFEREVTGERIRDKMAASKKKGMWMGGRPPLGYYRKDKKIYPDEEKSKIINDIFTKYLELKSTTLVKEWLVKRGYKLSVGNLNCILRNKAYIGLVGHKGTWYKGEHQGIITQELFEQVQNVMAGNRISRQNYNPGKSLLAGKLYDDNNNTMSPSWSTGSKGKKYRYYVSQAIIKHQKEKIGKTSKISLPEIEKFIDSALNNYLYDKRNIYKYIKDYEITKQEEILRKLRDYTLTREIERLIIKQVDIKENEIIITVYIEQLKELLNSIYENRQIKILKQEELKGEESFTLPYKIGIIDNGAKVIIGQISKEETHKNKQLIEIIYKAYKWHKSLLEGKTLKEISEEEKISTRYILKILQISFISPKIIKQILEGKQAKDLILKKLERITNLTFEEQEKAML